jgi:beta-lactam-binding protein with PASTA domain
MPRGPIKARPVRYRVWTAGRLLILVAALALTYGVFFLAAMRVASRAREVTVPDVRGKSLDEATTLLAQVGLTVRSDPQRRADPKVPADHVLVQSPDPGAVLRRQRAVRVHLSEGVRAPVVPDVVGKLERTAELALADARVEVATRSEIRSSQYGINLVVAQDPPATRRAGGVNILVNRGEAEARFVMPDLIGAPFDRIASVLRSSNFRIGVSAYVPYPGLPPGIIVSQTPQAGFQVAGGQSGDLISVEVSR